MCDREYGLFLRGNDGIEDDYSCLTTSGYGLDGSLPIMFDMDSTQYYSHTVSRGSLKGRSSHRKEETG
jgi:hypothetical protein